MFIMMFADTIIGCLYHQSHLCSYQQHPFIAIDLSSVTIKISSIAINILFCITFNMKVINKWFIE